MLFNSRMFSSDEEYCTLEQQGRAQQSGARSLQDPPSYISFVEKYSSDSVKASSLSTSRRSESRVMVTSREQSEPVLQCSVPEGRRSLLTLYKVWARKERGQRRQSTI